MKRKLVKQICAEWRSNVWLFIELLIVTLVLWWINDYFYSVRQIRIEPYGYDTRGVYMVHYSWDSSKYREGLNFDSISPAQMDAVIKRLRAEPAVSSVSLSCGITPHNYNFQGTPLFFASDSTLNVGFPGHPVCRYGIDAMGDICKTLGIVGANGETPAQLDDILREGKALITANVQVYSGNDGDDAAEKVIDAADMVGKSVFVNSFGDSPVTIGGLILPQKRATYESAADMVTILLPRRFSFGVWGDILVRVKDDYTGDFVSDLRERLGKDYQLEYLYLTDVEAMEDIKAFNDRNMDQEARMYIAMCLFLMLNVFLGLLGSFWFRTRQRAAEIAIRMVNGATPRHILMRVVAEPLLLLGVTIPFAAGGVWLLYGISVLFSPQLELPVIATVSAVGLVTYAEMAVMVVLGVLFPALKAMRTRPAVVLQEE